MEFDYDAKIDGRMRLELAIDSLDSIRDFCISHNHDDLHIIDSDHFGSLLGILIKEMRAALTVHDAFVKALSGSHHFHGEAVQ